MVKWGGDKLDQSNNKGKGKNTFLCVIKHLNSN